MQILLPICWARVKCSAILGVCLAWGWGAPPSLPPPFCSSFQ